MNILLIIITLKTTMETNRIIANLSEIPAIAEDIIKKYPKERIFGFYGGMGAGKTTLIKAICENMGATDQVSSPTFAIVNEYFTSSGSSIYHFDFYRIENLKELQQIGFEEYLESGNYCFMEWTEKVEPVLERDFIKITLTTDEYDQRHITY